MTHVNEAVLISYLILFIAYVVLSSPNVYIQLP